ncbi:hypothetical protein [Streptomyces sp. NBC_01803]|uniref:hypothetical protein n=1 Tax=Streptomyces sp. NBC_01803 TaxID=2975946 RepID=UPI002DDA6528|nr:hypothetical protein [Streptomyces sp. NBC_01803]WSA47312.1 hypothetical protein OIE51_25940 [Streptomyces sp. NBC_01803]
MPTVEQGVRRLPSGRWWEAVRVPAYRARHVLTWLGSTSGAVLLHQDAEPIYTWLIRLGAADMWDQATLGVMVPRPGTVIRVPPATWCGGPGTRWLVPTGPTGLTSPDRLRRALEQTPLGGTYA